MRPLGLVEVVPEQASPLHPLLDDNHFQGLRRTRCCKRVEKMFSSSCNVYDAEVNALAFILSSSSNDFGQGEVSMLPMKLGLL